jgi:hypothetical protein
MGIHEIQVRRTQALQTPTHTVSYPSGGVIELIARDATSLCDEEVAVSGRRRSELSEGVAEEKLGGAIIGRCIETENIVGKGASDNVGIGHVGGIGVILVVEGGGPEDERREGL